MNKETFTFELIDKYLPETIIRNLLKQIEEATRGYVIGNIAKYDGPIRSYAKHNGLAALKILQAEERVDIQEAKGGFVSQTVNVSGEM